MMHSDVTFITNEQNQNLKDRFNVLIKDSRFFDSLVGYFYISGFHSLYKSLENTEKIRILIGISTNNTTKTLIEKGQKTTLSHYEVKQECYEKLIKEMEKSEDTRATEEGIKKFIEWINTNKLEIRAYPSRNIHAKLYIMTFPEKHIDIGRVITGSSNFTKSGLEYNLEFNVELKDASDYNFAKKKFEELWSDSVDISEKYVHTIQEKTWLKNLTPYELYLKFLYEYFKVDLNQINEFKTLKRPPNFLELNYQRQAVLNAKRILEEYGGVFISDVVGLGKTYIATMLASQLGGGTLIIAPPSLIKKSNPNSWENVRFAFGVSAHCESIGKLDSIIKQGTDKYQNIIIDEAHHFRTETTQTYEKLAKICRGKKVILVTATPYNNSPLDILSLIKLFQPSRKSTIPNLPNIEAFFQNLEKKLKNLDRKRDYSQYLNIVKENAKEIREKVLKYLMIRRTRREIEKYFSEDLQKQNLKFPEITKPKALFYKLNKEEEEIFNKTIELISTKFSYARYMPMLYYKGEVEGLNKQGQKNMGKFMKILLIKRLESSFHAFKKSINRFIHSYTLFIDAYEKGTVYISKDYNNKIYEFFENDDDEKIQKLIETGDIKPYSSKDFKKEFQKDLQNDLETLREIKKSWQQIERDPKLSEFLKELSKNKILKNNKILIFTESKETAQYITKNLEESKYRVICFTGGSNDSIRDIIIDNFNAKAQHQKDDYRILVTTEVLSEGVNLHRANVVINYDIPWNPTRLMQRVGRVNRVDTKHKKIHIFNFFPTEQSNDQIKLKESAQSKIHAFLTLLGGDAELLTEGEPIGSHELFKRLQSKESVIGEEDENTELKYLHVIQSIQNKNPSLFDSIKRLPKKARTSRFSRHLKSKNENKLNSLISYFRLGKIQKFFISSKNNESKELDFISAAQILEAKANTPQQKLGNDYYNLLEKNQNTFIKITTEELQEKNKRSVHSNASKLLKIIRSIKTEPLTEDQEDFIKKVKNQLIIGSLPKATIKQALKKLDALNALEIKNPLKILATLQVTIPPKLLESHSVENHKQSSGQREVILSEYLIGEKNE